MKVSHRICIELLYNILSNIKINNPLMLDCNSHMRFVSKIILTRHTILQNQTYYLFERTGKLYDGIKSPELLFPVDKYKKWHKFPASGFMKFPKDDVL